MTKQTPTPHIAAAVGDFAPTVLMPGDPLRAKFIAETYLTQPRLVTSTRGILGFTGQYAGQPVSVMASGMGMPSISIYAHELFAFYQVESIIRVGTAGAVQPELQLRDIVVGMGACTDSAMAAQAGAAGFAPIADYSLLKTFCTQADAAGCRYAVGNLFSTDSFYGNDPGFAEKWGNLGVLATEMEAAALYLCAARMHKRALAVCTVSDHLITGASTTAEQRQTAFRDMMELALKTAALV